jgi:hypothetical protein
VSFRNTWNIERYLPCYGWVPICTAPGEDSATIAWNRLKPDAKEAYRFRLTRPDGTTVKTSESREEVSGEF